MGSYHSYVFDEENRRFVGQFEAMYKAETHASEDKWFDSWHQDDLRSLTKRICLEIFNSYNFNRVLDIGCGKGALTQYFKKANNEVIAVDLSETALKVARGRYHDIKFVQADIAVPDFNWITLGQSFDLVVCLETLSYLETWQSILSQFAKIGRYALLALYIPDNPIGFVKSFDDLETVFSANFTIIEHILLRSHRQIILFGEAKHTTT